MHADIVKHLRRQPHEPSPNFILTVMIVGIVMSVGGSDVATHYEIPRIAMFRKMIFRHFRDRDIQAGFFFLAMNLMSFVCDFGRYEGK